MNGYKTDQIEYVFDEWSQAVRDSRLYYESEAKKLNERLQFISSELERIALELERIRSEEELITQATSAFKARLEQPPKRSPLQGDNLRETLIIHFADPKGIITGKVASRSLVEIGYFPDRNSADSAIYTALAKLPFKKLDKGIYVIPTDSHEWSRLKGTNGKKLDLQTTEQPTLQYSRKVSNTDVGKKVLDILIMHPDWGVKQVSEELQRQGWDFGDKNPNLVVSAAFLNIDKYEKRAANPASPPRIHSTS